MSGQYYRFDGKNAPSGGGRMTASPAAASKGDPKVKPGPAKRRRKKQKSKSILRLQQALNDFGSYTKADGIYGRDTQNAINRVRSNWPTAPKRKRDFSASVREMTKWLIKNKDTGRQVMKSPPKEKRSNRFLDTDYADLTGANMMGNMAGMFESSMLENNDSTFDKKRPLRENQKAARSEMLSRILTERLLGRNVKIKNN
jgi:hypothetical protein